MKLENPQAQNRARVNQCWPIRAAAQLCAWGCQYPLTFTHLVFPPPLLLADVRSLQMAAKKPAPSSGSAVDGLVGFDIETGGQFDPLGFGRNCPPEQMQW